MGANGGNARDASELDRYDALAIVCAVERMLARPPVAVRDLGRMLAAMPGRDVVAIDDGVGEAIDAIDPVLEPNGLAARKLLRSLRAGTRRRAASSRMRSATVRRRRVV
jgi:hypothetical protein